MLIGDSVWFFLVYRGWLLFSLDNGYRCIYSWFDLSIFVIASSLVTFRFDCGFRRILSFSRYVCRY